MRVLVTGANGFIGGYVVSALLDAGHQVVGAVRDPDALRARFPGLDALECDLNRDTSIDAWLPRLAGIDAVVNCAGVMQGTLRQDIWAIHADAPKALFDACAKARVRRVVQVSAISVGAETEYARSKRAADEHLMALDLDWVVLRPSLVYAEGSYGGTSVLRALAAMPLVLAVVGSGAQPFSPLHARDLARIVVECLTRDDLKRRLLEPVGPERITQRDLLFKLRAWLGLRPAAWISIPLWQARLVAWGGRFLGTVSLNREALEQLEHGNAGDPAALEAALGWLPERMDAWLARHPAQAQDLLHARMQLFRAPTTLALSTLWIVSGIVGLRWTGLFTTEIGFPLGLDGESSRMLAYALCALDVALGVLVLLRWRVAQVAWAQFLVVAGYTVALTAFTPELWGDPYGALLKNLAVLVLIPLWSTLESERR